MTYYPILFTRSSPNTRTRVHIYHYMAHVIYLIYIHYWSKRIFYRENIVLNFKELLGRKRAYSAISNTNDKYACVYFQVRLYWNVFNGMCWEMKMIKHMTLSTGYWIQRILIYKEHF